MDRILSPPRQDWDALRQPLTEGERLVAEFFDKLLPPEWEIYIQPHLNGLRPDFVLLHPKIGIAVFEVKDWNLEAMKYKMVMREGIPTLMAYDSKSKKWFRCQTENPIEKVLLYKREIYELYCPSLPQGQGLTVITAGVIFPCADDDSVKKLFRTSRLHHNMNAAQDMFPITGRDSLEKKNLKAVFPRSILDSCEGMNEDVAGEARAWLREPQFSKDQRARLVVDLDDIQFGLASSRTRTGYRRIKGAAGSGKSHVLAGRAAELAYQKKDVLVVTYNITLINYLSDLAVRWTGGAARRSITWLNFHRWCKRVAEETDNMEDYRSLWKDANDDDEDDNDQILLLYLPERVGKWIEEDKQEITTRYDAILVDEGQDFHPKWWNVLRKVCKPGGEMILVVDSTQDIFSMSQAWSGWREETMQGCGFRGPWKILSDSHRLPPRLASLAEKFVKEHLPSETAILPKVIQEELDLFPCRLKWVQIAPSMNAAQVCCDEIITMLFASGKDNLTVAELTVLVDNQNIGMEVEKKLEEKNIRTITTFSTNEDEARRKKMAFFMGSEKAKLTTIHSFKGWESRALVIYTGRCTSPRDKAIFYTAITRLKRNDRCSYLTVVCAEPRLKSYGQAWPEYIHLPGLPAPN